jgi:hypothetical protein
VENILRAKDGEKSGILWSFPDSTELGSRRTTQVRQDLFWSDLYFLGRTAMMQLW